MSLSFTSYKNQIKIEWRIKCKTERNCFRPLKWNSSEQGFFFPARLQKISNKCKNKNMGLCQTTKLHHSKGNNQQNEEATYKWEMLVNYTSEGFILRLNKGLNSKKAGNPVKRWAINPNSHFLREDIKKAHRYMKKMLTILNHQTTMRYHFISIRIPITKKTKEEVLIRMCRKQNLWTYLVKT